MLEIPGNVCNRVLFEFAAPQYMYVYAFNLSSPNMAEDVTSRVRWVNISFYTFICNVLFVGFIEIHFFVSGLSV